jgi:hypothetical protein
MWMAAPEHTAVWTQLDKAVETGSEAWSPAHGKPVYEYFDASPAARLTFQNAMTSLSRMEAPGISQVFDFTPFATICDIGGGCGALLATALRAAPKAKGMLFETPAVANSTAAIDATLGDTKPRVTVVAGDMFNAESNFPKADLFTLKYVTCDFADERCKKLLTNCAKNLNKGGKVVILDQVVGDQPNVPSPTVWIDTDLLISAPSGRMRTLDEFKTLLTASGLKFVKVFPTEYAVQVVVAEIA